MPGIYAAAGLAEYAWAEFACMVFFSMGIVSVVALFALALRSQRLAVLSTVLLLLASIFFEPWYLFAPFEEAAYADPDVQSAAVMFRKVGVTWVVTCVAAAGSLVFTFLFPRRGLQVDATPEGASGPPGEVA
jgi:hypothetical protein